MITVKTNMYGTVPETVRKAAAKTAQDLGYGAIVHIHRFQVPTDSRATGNRGLLEIRIEEDISHPELKGLGNFFANALKTNLIEDGYQVCYKHR